MNLGNHPGRCAGGGFSEPADGWSLVASVAAVAAVPARGDKWAYLSSGTWSLLGAELAEPVVTPAACEAGFTNEVGLGGTIRFLKNIAGLWVLQECRRAWESAGRQPGQRSHHAPATGVGGDSCASRSTELRNA